MDATTLFYRTRRSTRAEAAAKLKAVDTAYEIVRSLDPNIRLADFRRSSADLVTRKLGSDALDSYLTSTMPVISHLSNDVDIYLASVLNSITIQMNFQTRIFLDGPPSVLLDGDLKYFGIAMMHGNMTQGLFLGDASGFTAPKWANIGPSFELNMERVHVVDAARAGLYLDAHGCRRIGAIMIVDPRMDQHGYAIGSKFSHLADRLTPNTLYCIAASADAIMAAADDLLARHPNAKLHIKLYEHRSGRARAQRGILVFSGVDGAPDLMLKPATSIPISFGSTVATHPRDDVDFISYASGFAEGLVDSANGKDKGIWEKSSVRRPFLLSSSAPLPAEAQERIAENFDVLHSMIAIDNGYLIQSANASHAQFMHAASDGAIYHDYLDNPAVTPLFQNSLADSDGVRRTILVPDRVLRVDGPAMPLMFTPTLHSWHSHFMIQCLPRVRIAHDLGEDITFLVPHDLRRKQLEMLELLGIGRDRLAFMRRDDVVQAERLYVPCPWRLVFTKYSLGVYEVIASKLSTQSIVTPKRVLISRESRKSWRNMINYEAVRDRLVNEYGFEVIAPERMTLAEEVATFANAEIIVGAEGAGMYGGVFSGPGTKFITLCDEDYVMPILGTIASIRGFDIGYVFGESFRADIDVDRRLPQGHADFVLDVARVEQAIQRTIALQEAQAPKPERAERKRRRLLGRG